MTTVNIRDYQIFQREDDGFARVQYRLTTDEAFDNKDLIKVQVVSEKDGRIVVPFTECEKEEIAEANVWKTELMIPQGGLYRVEAVRFVCGGNQFRNPKVDIRYHVGVGDIYVMAGQSNMAGYGRGSADDPPELGVHLFNRRGEWTIAAHPLCDSAGSPYGYDEYWTASSPALSFARNLAHMLHVPVGLIPAAVGGCPLCSFAPSRSGENYLKMCAMIRDAGGFKGMLWYQGCNEAVSGEADTYYEEFKRIVLEWYRDLGKFPIITVQLNRWAGNGEDCDRGWGTVREAQRKAAEMMPGVFTVPSIDLPVSDGIHNSASSNVILGERLALTALKGIYQMDGRIAPMVLSARRIDEKHLCVRLTPGSVVKSVDELAHGMDVEDENGISECIRAQTESDTLVIETQRSYALPAYFHYAWRVQPPAYVARDESGLPLLACYRIPVEE